MIALTPEIGFAAGAAVGTVLDIIAQHKVNREDVAFTEAYGGVHTVPSRSHRLARVTLGMALTGGMVGAYNAAVWGALPGPEPVPGHIELIVDHSGATASGEHKPVDQIDKLAVALGIEGVDVHAMVPTAEEPTRSMRLDEIASDEPFGDPPLGAAMNAAYENEKALRQASIGKDRQSMGIVALVNGNSLGDPNDIIAKATANNAPVYVVNVQGKEAEVATIQGLQKIAKDTNGKYYEVEPNTAQAVARDVKNDLTTNLVRNKGNKGDLRDHLLGGVGVGGLIGAFIMRRNSARNPNSMRVRGEKE